MTTLLAQIRIAGDDGVVAARQGARHAAALTGFDDQDQTRIATATSELARNAHRYARGGRMRIELDGGSLAVEVIDSGDGIPDLDAVLSGAYRSQTGMGRGLQGVRRLMDTFDVQTGASGTIVRIAKALPHAVGDADQIAAIRTALARPDPRDTFAELELQNEELLRALGELRARQDELVALNRELEETNRGVVALYGELDDQARRLRDADENKTRFLASLSHELRTPLNSILALTELLDAKGAGPALSPDQLRQIGYIRRMAQEQLEMINDLLDIAKIEAGRIGVDVRVFSVAEMFAMLRAQLRPLVADGAITLSFEAAPGLPDLHTDEGKIFQVLRNFISNAVKFTAVGSVLVRAEAAGGDITFSVTDSGVGIDEEDLDRIFEEFEQVAGSHQDGLRGTGLGLPLCRRLAGVLGGSVDVTSALGQGSTFRLTVPARHAGLVPGEAPILVIDDDEPTRYVVSSLLTPLGWTVTEADSGAGGLQSVGRQLPAAIVLDLSMPEVDGYAVLERLRARADTNAIPVVVHTSSALSAEDRARLAALHAAVLDKSRTSRDALLSALTAASGEVSK